MLLSKDQILAADDIKSERVPVPEWGGDVMVRGLTGSQRDAWEAGLTVRRGKQMVPDMRNFRARLVVLCCVDEAGELVFGPGDIDALSGKSGAALDRLYDAAAKLSGISEKDVEDLTGDFGKADGGGSSST